MMVINSCPLLIQKLQYKSNAQTSVWLLSVQNYLHIDFIKCLISLTLLLLVGAAHAESGVDLVLVIDQSGSMWGHPAAARGVQNDVHGYRNQAATVLLEDLAMDVANTRQVHRVSVVEFATAAEVTVQALEISFDPTQPDKTLYDALQAARSVGDLTRFGGRGAPVGNFLTNTPAALQLAAAEMQRLRSLASGSKRVSAIVLITDGRPYVVSGNYPVKQSVLFAEIESALRLAKVDQPWVLAIRDRAGSVRTYWEEGDGNRWQEIIGNTQQARLIDRPETDLHRVLHVIKAGLLGSESDVVHGALEVPAYLSRMLVRVNMGQPVEQSASLHGPAPLSSVYQPKGRVPAPGQPQLDMVFEVANPVAGEYRVDYPKTASGNRLTGQIAYDYFGAHPLMIQPTSAIPRDLASKFQFALALASDADLAVEDPNWPLRDGEMLLTSLDDPNAAVERIPLSYTQGLFNGQWTPNRSGRYAVRVRATTTGKNGYKRDVFSDSVDELYLDVLDVPAIEAVIPILNTQDHLVQSLGSGTIVVQLQLARQGSDAPLRITEMLETDSIVNGTIQLVHATGQAIVSQEAIPLELFDEYHLSAELPFTMDVLNGEGWLYPGQINLRLNSTPWVLRNNEVYAGLRLPSMGSENSRPVIPESESQQLTDGAVNVHSDVYFRPGGEPDALGGIAVQLPVWLGIMLAIFALLLVAVLAFLVWLWFWPLLRVRRLDRARKQTFRLLLFDAEQDPMQAQAVVLNVTGLLHAKFDGRGYKIDGRSKVFRFLRWYRERSGRDSGTLVYALDKKSKKHRVVINSAQAVALPGIGNGSWKVERQFTRAPGN